MFTDIYVALLGEFPKKFLNVTPLETNSTPEEIRMEEDDDKVLLRDLIRKFARTQDKEYLKCTTKTVDAAKLPRYYPHEKYTRKNITIDNSDAISECYHKENEVSNISSKPQKLDDKNDYARAMFSF